VKSAILCTLLNTLGATAASEAPGDTAFGKRCTKQLDESMGAPMNSVRIKGYTWEDCVYEKGTKFFSADIRKYINRKGMKDVKECTIELQRPSSLKSGFDTWTRRWKDTYLMTPDEKKHLSIHRPVLMLRAVLDFLQNENVGLLNNTYECPNKRDADEPKYHAEQNPYHRLYIATEDVDQSEEELNEDMETIKMFVEGQKWTGSLLNVRPMDFGAIDGHVNKAFKEFGINDEDARGLTAESAARLKQKRRRDQRKQDSQGILNKRIGASEPRKRKPQKSRTKRLSRAHSRRGYSSKPKSRSQEIQELSEKVDRDGKWARENLYQTSSRVHYKDEETHKLAGSPSPRSYEDYAEAFKRRQQGNSNAPLGRKVSQDPMKSISETNDLPQNVQDAIAKINGFKCESVSSRSEYSDIDVVDEISR